MDSNFTDMFSVNNQNEISSCQYYTTTEFLTHFQSKTDTTTNRTDNYHRCANLNNKHGANDNFSLLHLNARSIKKNFDSLETLLNSLNQFQFSVIGISETWLTLNSPDVFKIANYHMIHDDRKIGRGGGVALYIHNKFRYTIKKEIYIEGIENVFIEIENKCGKNLIIGILYKPPNYNLNRFLELLDIELEKIVQENKYVYIMGDFNIDISQSVQSTIHVAQKDFNNYHENESGSNKFLDILSSYSLFPSIKIPTRITPQSATLIDNIFTNTSDKENNSGVFSYDVSDHLPIFMISSQLKFKNFQKKKKVKFRKENSQNISALNKDLEKEEWQIVYSENDVNKAYEAFITRLTYYYDKNIPLIESKGKKNESQNPWITKGIFNSIKVRNKLYKLYLKKPSEQSLNKYKQYRNRLTSIIKTSKKMHYSKELGKAEGDLNATWKVINNITNRNKQKAQIERIKIDNNELTDSAEIANAFNSYFTSIGPDLASQIKSDNCNFTQFLNRPSENTMFFVSTHQYEIKEIVKKLKSKSSAGYDGISTKLLKQIINNIASPLAFIFNLSLTTGTCPDLLKLAKVIPIYKKDNPNLLTNYRPISLLPCISKILEKIIYKRLNSFLCSNKILNSSQFGFRKHYSTDFAITKLLDKITHSVADKQHVIALFMDLSKAFDTIDHNILLYKLRNYGIRGIALSWIKSYLTNRQQFVSIDNLQSSRSVLKCGVPQGSILGPLLFLIYVNDIINSSSILSFILFADDTNVLFSHKNLAYVIETFNFELQKISSWFKCNKLSLNISKTNFMHFKSSHQDIDLSNAIKIDSLPLEQKDNVKFLGITIDKHLTWNQHIRNISLSIAKGIGIMYRVKDVLLENSLLMIYNALILPYINYCNIVWGNCPKNKLDQILLLQKKAVRICTRSSYLSHTNPLFHRLKILKVHDINTMHTAIFMFKYNNKLLPRLFNDFFSLNKTFHSYPTRRSNDFHLDNPRTLQAQRTLRHHGPDVWNTLPDSVKRLTTLYTIKRKLKEVFLQQYTE